MLPNLENNVLGEICILFTVITPLEVDSILFITIPLGFIVAEIPLLDERNIFFPSSIALKIDFEKCINDKKIEDFVLNDRIEGAKNFKVNATPTIIINNKKFEKSLNYKNLKKSLEKLI